MTKCRWNNCSGGGDGGDYQIKLAETRGDVPTRARPLSRFNFAQ